MGMLGNLSVFYNKNVRIYYINRKLADKLQNKNPINEIKRPIIFLRKIDLNKKPINEKNDRIKTDKPDQSQEQTIKTHIIK